jgi:hypothetical protein
MEWIRVLPDSGTVAQPGSLLARAGIRERGSPLWPYLLTTVR